MKVATCVPVPFQTNEHFFNRDSGLLCRGFNSIGANCSVVLAGEADPADSPLLVRATPLEMESDEWWKKQNFDLVVLYGWANPKYMPIARAIQKSGAKLVQNIDAVGFFSPYADWKEWIKQSACWLQCPGSLNIKLKTLYQVMRDFVPALYEKKRLEMLKLSDSIACVSPYASDSMRSYCQAMGGSDLARNVRVVPHPVNPIFTYTGTAKENCVIAVGRWDTNSASQKNPELLMEVLTAFLAARPDWKARIVGRGAEELGRNHAGEKNRMTGGIEFINFLDHAELKSVYAASKIMLCVSRHESFHISSAEAVCCGCSVVVPQRASLGSTAWFTSADSGRIAERYEAQCIVETLKQEADCWVYGERNPDNISKSWTHRLHAGAVASNLLKI